MQAQDGHDVIYASAGGRYVDLLESCGAQRIHLPQNIRNPIAAAASGRKLFALCRHLEPTILHAPMKSGTVIGFAVSRMLGLPLVTTVHNSFDRHSWLMRLGDQVVAVSRAERSLLLARGFDRERLHVVLNGTISSPREGLRSARSLQIRRPCIATVCGLEKRKGVDNLIEAFSLIASRISHWGLYIAGDGPERPALEAIAHRAGLADRVHFLGYVDNPRQLLENTDIFVLASRAEPFGLSLVEARHAGCAVVGTRVGGIPELLEFGRAGALVAPDDSSELAKALIALATEATALATAQQNAKRNIEHFNIRRVADDYLRIYEFARQERASRARKKG